jgi:threonine dehydratase
MKEKATAALRRLLGQGRTLVKPGAYNALSRLDSDQCRRGVVAFSSGNHAQAVALAAQLLGIPATIVMPQDAPAWKLAATRDYGANFRLYDRYGKTLERMRKTTQA